MSRWFQLLLHKTWEKDKGPRNLFLWLLILALASAYAAFFPFLMEAFGATARVFPSVYLAIGAVSWGLRGAFLLSILNSVLGFVLHAHAGVPFEGGIVGPVGSLFATSLVGMISDMAKELEKQLEKRKRAEAAKEESEQGYRRIFDTILECILITDTDMNVFDVNGAAIDLYGYTREEFTTKKLHDLIHPECHGQFRDSERSIEENGLFVCETRNLRNDGSAFYAEVRSTRLQLEGKDYYLSIVTDITERKKADQKLRESEEKYRRLFDMESDAIFLIDNASGKILEANEAATIMYGYTKEEFLTLHNTDISAEPDSTRIATEEKWDCVPVRYHRKKAGAIFPVEISARHYIWQSREVHVAAIRDISTRMETEKEKRELEAQFYKSQKMESVGTLAGGIAHDFNNLLGGIMGNAELAVLRLKSDKHLEDYLNNINRITKSGAKLTKQLLGYARGGKYQVKPTNLNDLIAEHDELFGRTNKQILIRQKFETNLWTTDVDRGQIGQVLMNIYVNARHAMPDGGTLTVETDNVFFEKPVAVPFPLPKGYYVKVAISDTGIGMNEETLQKVFDPFFTTKEIGRGTGLGMASVYGIIKNHDGYIHVTSEPEKGTTVVIFLPRSGKESIADAKVSEGRVAKGSGTILFVDDEEAVLEVTRQMMEVMGYNVLTADSGEKAIEIYKDNRHHIDLVLLDIIMPHMGGEETIAKIKEINPKVNVLVATGYSLDQKADELRRLGCKGFIQKPFQMTALSLKIKELININR